MTVLRRPTVAFVTLGCPKNEVDSDRMAASLPFGLSVAEELAGADVAVVNTCSFIGDATEESIAAVMELAGEWKSSRAGRVIVVAGCMVSRYGDALADAMPEADAFVPVADEPTLGRVIAGLLDLGESVGGTGEGPTRTAPGPSAYLQVSDGCHRRCAYCTIPAIRGDFRSVPAADVLAEARLLVDGGAREIVLVGQDVSAWGRDLRGQPSLADLVRDLAAVPGLAWLRLMYVQPDGITPDLLDAMASAPNVCRYLDMPLQHASTPILRRMERRGSGAEFLRLVGVVRDMLPGVFLRTTVIAGFPGETRRDAARLEDFLRNATFDFVGVFPYSPEEGTPAADMPHQVSARTRRARAQRLRDVADGIGTARVASLVGATLEVLAEGLDEEGAPFGRHRGQAPEVDGVVMLDRDLPAGTLAMVDITDALGYDLIGEVRS